MYQDNFRFTISYTPVAGDLPQVVFTNSSRAAWTLVEAFYALNYDTLTINGKHIIVKMDAYKIINDVCILSKQKNQVSKELV